MMDDGRSNGQNTNDWAVAVPNTELPSDGDNDGQPTHGQRKNGKTTSYREMMKQSGKRSNGSII